jgi:Fic family protein
VDLTKFTDNAPGQLVRIAGTDPRSGVAYEHRAFVPDPLPDDLSFERATSNAISRAMLTLGRLDQATEWVPDPMLLLRPAIRREAVSTSALEGTVTAFEDVLGADTGEEDGASAEVSEVLNYVRAAESAYDWVRKRRITSGLLSELQRTLVRGTRSDGPTAGSVRETPVLIGPDGCRIDEARFVPPPPGDQLTAGLREWEVWVNREDDLPILAKVVMAHYQFETLHPFTDGNGRLGRLVAILQLLRHDVLHYPMLNISPWLNAHREAYQDHLLRVSQTGEFDPFIRFFCEAVEAEAEAATERVRALMDYRAEMLGNLRRDRIRGIAIDVAESLLGQPVISVGWVVRTHGVSYPTANTAVRRLEQAGVIREMTGRTYGRMFAATQVLRIVRV